MGRAFRAPTLDEKFVELAFCKGVVCGQPTLVPERSIQLDAGFKSVWRFLSFELYGFNTFIDDFITLADTTETGRDYAYVNLPRAWLVGGEARLVVNRANLIGNLGFRFWSRLAYTRGAARDTELPLP